ncbi:Uncharacterized protein OBRU01_20327, partial [Operophtera brumata]
MYQEHEGVKKTEKNKFESSISELKKKTFVTAADIESYIDRHVASGKGEQLALIHDSPITDTVRRITYNELKDQ